MSLEFLLGQNYGSSMQSFHQNTQAMAREKVFPQAGVSVAYNRHNPAPSHVEAGEARWSEAMHSISVPSGLLTLHNIKYRRIVFDGEPFPPLSRLLLVSSLFLVKSATLPSTWCLPPSSLQLHLKL